MDQNLNKLGVHLDCIRTFKEENLDTIAAQKYAWHPEQKDPKCHLMKFILLN